MNYDLVVFDIAGTTVDDGEAVGECLATVVREHFGAAASRDEVNRVMGLPKPAAIRLILTDKGQTPADAAVDAAHADFVDRMIRFYRTAEAVRPMPSAADVFRTLRGQGVRVALDTGFDKTITDTILDRFGWTAAGGLVDAVATSDQVPAGRPAPYMIFRLMQELDVRSVRRVVKVGDTPSDLHEGTNAGCGRVVGITHGTHTADQLRGHPHTDLVGSLTAIPPLLAGDPPSAG